MKAKLLLLSGLFGMFIMSSCGNGELTKGSAEDALEKEVVAFQDSSQVATLQTGYYQLDDKDARMTLRRLANAGVITYSADKVIEKIRRQQGWYNPTYYYVDVEHFFVKVGLTPEGEKFVVTNPVTEIVDKDMDYKIKESKFSMDVPFSDIEDAKPKATTDSSTSNTQSGNSGSSADGQAAEKSDYQKAKDRAFTVSYNVLTHKNKIVKIKNVFCPEESLKKGTATCMFIYENAKVTPFGYFIQGIEEGRRRSATASFSKYTDGGWKVSGIN